MRILITTIFCSLILVDKVNASSCAFCREEVIENQYVFKTAYFDILLDYEPRVKGHLLVIPKRHIVKAHEMSQEEWTELSVIIPKVVKVFSDFLHIDDYIIVEKNGRNAFQDVPHVHFHVYPVPSGKTWQKIFNIIPERLSPEELQQEVALFRSYFSS